MKSLHLVIIGVGIAGSIIAGFILSHGFLMQSLGYWHVTKIEKISGYDKMWESITPQTGDQAKYIMTGDFDWSKNGHLVAFNMNAGAPISYLRTMNMDNHEITPAKIPIEFNSVSYIHISPDSNSVYFIGQYNNKSETYQDIFRYYPSNQAYSLITKNSHVYSFDFMPDGNLVYVETHTNSTRLEKDRPVFLVRNYDVLWISSPEGDKIKPIYNGTQLFDGMSVSPNGSKIAFVSRDDPLHPSSNGTDVVNFGSLGGPIKNYPSYFTVFDINAKTFTIIKESNDDEFWNVKWISDDHILYETFLHQCVQDKTIGEQSCPAGLLDIMTVSDGLTNVLYGNQLAPFTSPLVGAAISPDGRSIIFGINYDYSNGDIDGKGIYEMTFDKPLDQ
jgi:hypothetical protein